MPDYVPIHQMVRMPDIVGNFQQGMRQGAMMREVKRKEAAADKEAADAIQLRNLAPKIMQGDPSAYSQAATINPEAATAYQDAGDRQYRRAANVAKIMRNAINTGDPRATRQAFISVRPFLSEFAQGQPVPEQWDESMLPKFEQFEARVSQAGTNDGQQRNLAVSPGTAIVNPETGQVVYERPYAPANASIVDVPDGKGGKMQMIFDPRTRQLSEPQYPGQLGGPSVTEAGQASFIGPDGIPVDTSGVTDPHVRDSIAANPAAFATVPSGSSARLPDQMGGQSSGAQRFGYTPPSSGADQIVQLSPEEVAALGLPPGTVAQRNTRTNGVDVISKPDARPGTGGVQPLSAGEAAKVRRDFKETRDALNIFRAFDSALAEVPQDPSLLVDGAARGRLGTAYNNARASLRILYNTGVLQPGELPMLENALRDPTTFSAVIDPRTRPQIRAQLDELYGTITQSIENQVASYPQIFNQQRFDAERNKSSGPRPGEVDGGYRFKGGDPSDSANWEKL